MAFGYEYWIVYLPELNPDSFLLFTHNPDGSTKLRDYSTGKERVLGQQPSVRDVRQVTEWGSTRFDETPHTVSGPDGERHWQSRIAGYNSRFMGATEKRDSARETASPMPARTTKMNAVGLAQRGSQRQLQDYVNLAPSALDHAILSALPIKVQQNSPRIKWVSPLADKEFREYRDDEFLSALGLGQFSKELDNFWPKFGPCWDALGILTTSLPGSLPIALLIEAKSHVPEVYGNGCQASGISRALIEKSVNAAKNWCGAQADSDWTGSVYQFANRIAHLYFIRQRLNRSCFLVNLHFVDDPYRPTSQSEWLAALEVIHRELGLTAPVPGLVEVFLRGRAVQCEPYGPSSADQIGAQATGELCKEPLREAAPAPLLDSGGQAGHQLSFAAWCKQWDALGTFQGSTLSDAEDRIQRVLELWQEQIPGRWQRTVDDQLLGSRYRRGDSRVPHPGEHTIEHQILIEQFGRISLLDGTLIDGVNAFPLACDFASGARCGNVEADMLLVGQSADGLRLVLCEVKADADDPWYAAVESLRQMRLFVSNPVGAAVMQKRGALLADAAKIPFTGVILAPVDYYCARGKKGNAVAPAKRLFQQMRQHFGIDMRLAVWEPSLNSIREL
jgi:hypothetical protein